MWICVWVDSQCTHDILDNPEFIKNRETVRKEVRTCHRKVERHKVTESYRGRGRLKPECPTLWNGTSTHPVPQARRNLYVSFDTFSSIPIIPTDTSNPFASLHPHRHLCNSGHILSYTNNVNTLFFLKKKCYFLKVMVPNAWFK